MEQTGLLVPVIIKMQQKFGGNFIHFHDIHILSPDGNVLVWHLENMSVGLETLRNLSYEEDAIILTSGTHGSLDDMLFGRLTSSSLHDVIIMSN